MKRRLCLRLFGFVACLMCTLGVNAAEPYVCHTTGDSTLTFYYDNLRSSRSGTTYSLNIGSYQPGWVGNGPNSYAAHVVFDPSFANARPTSTCSWFYSLQNLQSITGLNYLNTSEVTNMSFMFYYCNKLTSLDVSHFNTANVTSMWTMFAECSQLVSLDLSSFNTSLVTDMEYIFYNCTNLRTIFAGNGWTTAAVTYYDNMFTDCTRLVGGQGTTYDASHIDKTYARIDGGPNNPGYFTEKSAFKRGDVNGNNEVTIADVSALIDYLLTGDTIGINLAAADCNGIDGVTIADVSALIDYLLTGNW